MFDENFRKFSTPMKSSISPFPAHFGPLFGSNFGPISGSILAPFLVPLRGTILSENTRKPTFPIVLELKKRLSFGALFGPHFGSISGSILDPFLTPEMARGYEENPKKSYENVRNP